VSPFCVTLQRCLFFFYATSTVGIFTLSLHDALPIWIVPMRDGKLQGKNVFNRQELLWLQDKFPKHMQEKGFNLERGEKGSDREHMETRKFKKHMLEKDIDSLEKELAFKRNEV